MHTSPAQGEAGEAVRSRPPRLQQQTSRHHLKLNDLDLSLSSGSSSGSSSAISSSVSSGSSSVSSSVSSSSSSSANSSGCSSANISGRSSSRSSTTSSKLSSGLSPSSCSTSSSTSSSASSSSRAAPAVELRSSPARPSGLRSLLSSGAGPSSTQSSGAELSSAESSDTQLSATVGSGAGLSALTEDSQHSASSTQHSAFSTQPTRLWASRWSWGLSWGLSSGLRAEEQQRKQEEAVVEGLSASPSQLLKSEARSLWNGDFSATQPGSCSATQPLISSEGLSGSTHAAELQPEHPAQAETRNFEFLGSSTRSWQHKKPAVEEQSTGTSPRISISSSASPGDSATATKGWRESVAVWEEGISTSDSTNASTSGSNRPSDSSSTSTSTSPSVSWLALAGEDRQQEGEGRAAKRARAWQFAAAADGAAVRKADLKDGGGTSSCRVGRHCSALGPGPLGLRTSLFWWVLLLALLGPSAAWISLSKDGYSMKHSLIAQAGVKVTSDVNINGLVISKPVANLQCNPSRRGALRWNDEFFEGCDGETDWRPLTFCSRSCDIDTESVPCGLPVRNRCDGDCKQDGTGLNMRQCLLQVAETPCGDEVRDLCGNACGLMGQMDCFSSVSETGELILAPIEGSTASAKYGMTVGKPSKGSAPERDDAMYFTYYDTVANEETDMVLFALIDENFTTPEPVMGKPTEGYQGLDIAPPPENQDTTVRISMLTEFVGGYVKVGADHDSDNPSHIFLDSHIEKECPFLFNAGSYNELKFLKVCLEEPSVDQTIELPDASGVVLTSGNEKDLRSLPGLRGNNSISYFGPDKDMTSIPPKPTPRADCSAVNCFENHTDPSAPQCLGMDLSDSRFDIYRILYQNFPGDSIESWSSPHISSRVLQILHNTAQNYTTQELSVLYLLLQADEAGIDLGTNMSLQEQIDLQIQTGFSIGPALDEEVCFVCCCTQLGPSPLSSQTFEDLGVCENRRFRPQFCLNGTRIGEVCTTDSDCPGVAPTKAEPYPASGVCGYDEDIVLCHQMDMGYSCYPVWNLTNIEVTMHFENPLLYRRMYIADASGTVISSGNLEDITSIGLQAKPIQAKSAQETTTTIRFTNCDPLDTACSLLQVNQEKKNNTLLIPNEHDGVLLSSGNLEDVTLNSSAMTGLAVSGDVHVQGLLKFGDNPASSGLHLKPVPGSTEYGTPHSGRPSSRARPGQLSFQVGDSTFLSDGRQATASTTVLEFEPANASDHAMESRVKFPAVSGSVLTTGNLEALTAESGSLESLGASELSYMQGGLIVGTAYETQLILQGHADHSMTFLSEHSRSTAPDQYSKTVVSFELLDGMQNSITFPFSDGKVITTGNLPDIFAFSGSSIDASGEAHLRGQVVLGSETGLPNGVDETALSFAGFITGDILHRDPSTLPLPEGGEVAYPYQWKKKAGTICKSLEDLRSSNPLHLDNLYYTAFDVPSLVGYAADGTEEECRVRCVADDNCGVLLTSAYNRMRLLSLSSPPKFVTEQNRLSLDNQYLGVAPRKPMVSSEGVIVPDTCFPDNQDLVLYSSDFSWNHSTAPESRYHWRTSAECQAVVHVDTLNYTQWPEFESFRNLEVTLERCTKSESNDCSDVTACWQGNASCEVLIRSQITGSYLGGGSATACDDHSGATGCAEWSEVAMTWRLVPYDGPKPDAGWDLLGSNLFFHLQRAGACAQIQSRQANPVLLSCGSQNDLVDFEYIHTGMKTEVCGGLQAAQTQDCSALRVVLLRMCSPSGCSIDFSSGALKITSLADGEHEFAPSCADSAGSWLTVRAMCSSSDLYLGGERTSTVKGNYLMKGSAALGVSDVFHLHSATISWDGNLSVSEQSLQHDCWMLREFSYKCAQQEDAEMNVHLFERYRSTSLAFENASAARRQYFPNTDGTIISSGNTIDATHLRGLLPTDTFIYQHGPFENAPVTIVDFAAVGTGIMERLDGVLPQYTIDDGNGGTKEAHPVPENANRRITFPDATGTVITTGNIDDLVFQQLKLAGLNLDGSANFTNDLGQFAIVNFEESTRVSGCLILVDSFGAQLYTQVCIETPSGQNELDLPDVSGTVITTGNLLNLPAMSVDRGEAFIGGDVAIAGNMVWGSESSSPVIRQYAWIDGDIGMTFAAPTSRPAQFPEVMKLNFPHQGGIDVALRHYLTDDVVDLAVDVQFGAAFRNVVPGSERINHTVCNRVMKDNGVYDYHGLGYFLLEQNLLRPTKVHGTPYSAVLVAGNQTTPSCQSSMTGAVTCQGIFPSYCGCRGLGEFMTVAWYPVTRQAEVNPATNGSVYCSDNTWDCENVRKICNSSSSPDCAFDGDLSTFYISNELSLEREPPFVPIEPSVADFSSLGTNAFPENTPTEGLCILGMRFSTPVGATRVRIYPRPGYSTHILGGKLQASTDKDGENWVDLFTFFTAPKEDQWNDMIISDATTDKYYWVRYVGPGCGSAGVGENGQPCRCDVAEWEWHEGRITQRMSPLESGVRSYFVDDLAVSSNGAAAMVLKCASQRWFPVDLRTDVNELMIPETSGVILTSGNLEDITKEAGTITSLSVSGQTIIGGSVILGSPDEDSEIKIDALTGGRVPLSFAGSQNIDAAASFSVPDATIDNTVLFPPVPAGTIVTTGSLPNLLEQISIVGGADIAGNLNADDDVTIGDKLRGSTLVMNSEITTSYPMTFKKGDFSEARRSTIAVEEPSQMQNLRFPDAVGTVITTGNLPEVMESSTFSGGTVFQGNAKFVEKEINLGNPESKINMDIRSAIGGSVPLRFEGKSVDQRTLSLAVEEPAANNILFLPDVSGTVVTTGNLPDMIDKATILGELNLDGDTNIQAAKATIGNQDLNSRMRVYSAVSGRYPLVFSDQLEAGPDGKSVSTTFEITPPGSENLITFPDVSGTVLTSGNIPTSAVVDDEYFVQSASLLISASSLSLGPMARIHKQTGTFEFLDGSAGAASTASKTDQFFAVASGGVRFITGYTSNGKELGAVLDARSSSWSVLSDEDSKDKIEGLDTRAVVRQLSTLPIFKWRYDGQEIQHMGPLAQDFHDTFQVGANPRRIEGMDADGIAMAAVHGLYSEQSQLVEALSELRKAVERNDSGLKRSAELLEQNSFFLERGEQVLAQLELELGVGVGVGVGSTASK